MLRLELDALKPVPGDSPRMPNDPCASETDERKSLSVDKQVSRLELPDLEDSRCDLLGRSRIGIDAPQRPGVGDED
jgi:hypothetical protein